MRSIETEAEYFFNRTGLQRVPLESFLPLSLVVEHLGFEIDLVLNKFPECVLEHPEHELLLHPSVLLKAQQYYYSKQLMQGIHEISMLRTSLPASPQSSELVVVGKKMRKPPKKRRSASVGRVRAVELASSDR